MRCDHRQAVLAALVQPGDVSLAHFPNPIWVATKGARAEVFAGVNFGRIQHVQRGAKEQVKTEGGKFLAHHRSHLPGKGRVPGGANRHQIRQ